jgi:hypothetical protein
MKNQEVWVLMRGTYRNVVPADVVIFQVRLEPPREAAFAGGHPTHYARKDGDEVRHAKLSDTLSLLRQLWAQFDYDHSDIDYRMDLSLPFLYRALTL